MNKAGTIIKIELKTLLLRVPQSSASDSTPRLHSFFVSQISSSSTTFLHQNNVVTVENIIATAYSFSYFSDSKLFSYSFSVYKINIISSSSSCSANFHFVKHFLSDNLGAPLPLSHAFSFREQL